MIRYAPVDSEFSPFSISFRFFAYSLIFTASSMKTDFKEGETEMKRIKTV